MSPWSSLPLASRNWPWISRSSATSWSSVSSVVARRADDAGDVALDLVQVADVVLVDAGNEGAPAGDGVDEVLLRQLDERLADREAADAEDAGDLLLIDLLTRPEAPVEDLVAKVGGGLVLQVGVGEGLEAVAVHRGQRAGGAAAAREGSAVGARRSISHRRPPKGRRAPSRSR